MLWIILQIQTYDGMKYFTNLFYYSCIANVWEPQVRNIDPHTKAVLYEVRNPCLLRNFDVILRQY